MHPKIRKHPEVVNICISHACSSDTACVPHYFHSLSKYTLSYNSKRKIHNETPDFLIDKRWNTMDIDRIASCDNPITPTIIKALIVSPISSFSHDARQQNDQRRPVLLRLRVLHPSTKNLLP
jgi:hypothetical protein